MEPSPEAITQQIRVIIADDHPVVREGLAAILRSQEDIKIVLDAMGRTEAIAIAAKRGLIQAGLSQTNDS